jgi:hypothetical protein
MSNQLTFRCKGLQSGILRQGSNGFVSLYCRMVPEEGSFSGHRMKGISQMGITFFVIFIAAVMAGVAVLMLKNFLESTLRFKDYKMALDELEEFNRKNAIEHRRAEVFSHNYMVELEQARCQRQRRRKVVNAVT